MNIAIWQKLDYLARAVTPFCLSLLLVILSIIPTQIPSYMEIAPVLALVSIYHWAIYRPNLLPTISVFLLGLLQDLLIGAPVGLYTLVFLTVYGIVASQRRFFEKKSFIIYWFGFAVVSFLATIEGYLLGSVWHVTLLDFNVSIFQYLVSLGIFPSVAWIFLRWQQTFLQQDL